MGVLRWVTDGLGWGANGILSTWPVICPITISVALLQCGCPLCGAQMCDHVTWRPLVKCEGLFRCLLQDITLHPLFLFLPPGPCTSGLRGLSVGCGCQKYLCIFDIPCISVRSFSHLAELTV